EPFAGGGNPIVDLLTPYEVGRALTKGALPLTGAKADSTLPSVFLFGYVALKEGAWGRLLVHVSGSVFVCQTVCESFFPGKLPYPGDLFPGFFALTNLSM